MYQLSIRSGLDYFILTGKQRLIGFPGKQLEAPKLQASNQRIRGERSDGVPSRAGRVRGMELIQNEFFSYV